MECCRGKDVRLSCLRRFLKIASLASKMQNNPSFHKELPDKLYFRIGEVSDISGVPAYVLRFWETEFKKDKAKANSSANAFIEKVMSS